MLTIALWIGSFCVGGISFYTTKDILTPTGRLAFSLMMLLTAWIGSTFIFWLLGYELKIGTVDQGLMGENWWLPFVTALWAGLTYIGFNKSPRNS